MREEFISAEKGSNPEGGDVDSKGEQTPPAAFAVADTNEVTEKVDCPEQNEQIESTDESKIIDEIQEFINKCSNTGD